MTKITMSKFLPIYQRLIMYEKVSADLMSTAMSATHFKEYYGTVIKDREIVWVTSRRSYTIPSGVPGSGAGRGGGSGGSVRESGGGLGRYGAAQEEGYFLKKQREQLAKIKKKMKQESQHTDPTQKRKK